MGMYLERKSRMTTPIKHEFRIEETMQDAVYSGTFTSFNRVMRCSCGKFIRRMPENWRSNDRIAVNQAVHEHRLVVISDLLGLEFIFSEE